MNVNEFSAFFTFLRHFFYSFYDAKVDAFSGLIKCMKSYSEKNGLKVMNCFKILKQKFLFLWIGHKICNLLHKLWQYKKIYALFIVIYL